MFSHLFQNKSSDHQALRDPHDQLSRVDFLNRGVRELHAKQDVEAFCHSVERLLQFSTGFGVEPDIIGREVVMLMKDSFPKPPPHVVSALIDAAHEFLVLPGGETAALSILDYCLAQSRRLKDDCLAMSVFIRKGDIAYDAEQSFEALKYYSEAVVRMQRGFGKLPLGALHPLARLLDEGDCWNESSSRSEEYYRTILNLLREVPRPMNSEAAEAWLVCGAYALDRLDYDGATRCFSQVLHDISEWLLDLPLEQGEALGGIGELLHKQGEYRKAEESLRAGLNAAQQSRQRDVALESNLKDALADTLSALGRFDEAAQLRRGIREEE